MANVGEQTNATDLNNLDRVFWVAGVSTTTSTTPLVGTTETVVLTATSYTYKANNAYQVIVSGSTAAAATSNAPLYRIRKTNTSGTIFDQWRIIPVNATAATGVFACYFQVGASDVAATMVLTLISAAATTVGISAGANNPFAFNIFRCGNSSDFPGAITLT